MNEEKIIKGSVQINRLIFKKKDSDFGIVSVIPISSDCPELNEKLDAVMTGIIPNISDGEVYKVVLRESNHKQYGKQYEIVTMGLDYNINTNDGRELFLRCVMTDTQLDKLIDTYDIETAFNIIKSEDMDSMCKVKGIKKATAQSIFKKFKDKEDKSEIFVELAPVGLTPKAIENALKDFNGNSTLFVQKFRENPYSIIKSMNGIGFKKMDAYALKMGFPIDGKERSEGFAKFFLEEEAQNGNSWLRLKEDFAPAIAENLGPDVDKLKVMKHLLNSEDIKISADRQRIWLQKYMDRETEIAKELIRIKNAESNFTYDGWEDIVQGIEKDQGYEFTDQQKQGIETVLKENIVVITGKGGTGKSSIVKAMYEVLKGNYKFAQTALSGRAASRLFEVTGEEGKTIHRLLEAIGSYTFQRDEHYKLDEEVVILDEASMVDSFLFLKLIKAIRSGSKLVILGDTGQLESIGAGNVLMDIINSGYITHVCLTKIHRQAEMSAIVKISGHVREGKQVFPKSYEGVERLGELKDLELNVFQDKNETLGRIINSFVEAYERKRSILDIQITTPINTRGTCNNLEINKQVQNIINSTSKGIEISIGKDLKYDIRERDKVICNKNHYKVFLEDGNTETAIYNGSFGIVEKIGRDNMLIDFEGIGRVVVDKEKWNTITLGYAVSVHKLQGSEFDTVIFGIDNLSFKLLNRELLYTAITRAKKDCIIIAQNQAFRTAVATTSVSHKKTFLKYYLNDCLEK